MFSYLYMHVYMTCIKKYKKILVDLYFFKIKEELLMVIIILFHNAPSCWLYNQNKKNENKHGKITLLKMYDFHNHNYLLKLVKITKPYATKKREAYL